MKEVSLSNSALERLFGILVNVKPDGMNELRELHALFDVLEEPTILFEEKTKKMREERNALTAESTKTELKKEVREEATKKAEQIWIDFEEIHKCRVTLLLNQSNIDTIKRVIEFEVQSEKVFGRGLIRDVNEIRTSVCI